MLVAVGDKNMHPPEHITTREFDPQEIADAKELFLKYGKKNAHLIVREMRRRGWTKFKRGELCGRPQAGRHAAIVGLIDALCWSELYQEAAAEAGAVAEGEAEKEKEPEPRTFKEWLIETKPDWQWNWKYQNYIYKALGRFGRGHVKRMMVFMPPRHGKSEMITVRYAAWVLLMRPEMRIIIGSYNQKLANRFSRQIRRIYKQHIGEEGIAANPDLLRSADEWETAEGGGVKAVGAGAGVTGFGADLIIIDDPIKGTRRCRAQEQPRASLGMVLRRSSHTPRAKGPDHPDPDALAPGRPRGATAERTRKRGRKMGSGEASCSRRGRSHSRDAAAPR